MAWERRDFKEKTCVGRSKTKRHPMTYIMRNIPQDRKKKIVSSPLE